MAKRAFDEKYDSMDDNDMPSEAEMGAEDDDGEDEKDYDEDEENMHDSGDDNIDDDNDETVDKGEDTAEKAKKTSKKKKTASGGTTKKNAAPEKALKKDESGNPLKRFGSVRARFIMEHIRTIQYEDIADLLGIKPDELKAAVEKMGVKLPIERAMPWEDVDVGEFRDIAECARCQVQQNHDSFFVGINDCRKCYRENIGHWIEIGERITVRFPHE